MNPFSRAYMPTSNRRLNELIGFLLFVAAILLLLALISYSPADRSLNTAGPPPGSHPARNWIGILGAYGSDLLLQGLGISAFLLPVMMAFLGVRWFRSRNVGSPGAKFAGALLLLMFAPGMLGLVPGHLRWQRAIPLEGLLGRIVGDALIHWFNLAGAYIVCAAVLAIGLYLSTTFSFGALQTWAQTRFTLHLCCARALEGLADGARQISRSEGTGEASHAKTDGQRARARARAAHAFTIGAHPCASGKDRDRTHGRRCGPARADCG